MKQKDLDFFNECVDLISDYIFVEEMADIVCRIKILVSALMRNKAHHIDSLTKDTLCSVNFEQEGIPIKFQDKRHMSNLMRIKTNCFYIIDRLILLAFKKIAEHELDKQIPLSEELSTIYKTMKLDLELKKKS